MKKNLVFFALTTSCALALLISVLFMFSDGGERVEAATPPSDISGSFAEKEITYLVAAGLLDTENVDGKTFFYPEYEVTREYFAKTVIKFIGADTSAYDSFALEADDIGDIDEELLPYIKACVSSGLLPLYESDGKKYFLPRDKITREEAADVFGRLSNAVISTTKSDMFSDISDTEKNYEHNFEKLIDLNIIIGYPDKTVKPKNILTREELAVILYRIGTSKTFIS